MAHALRLARRRLGQTWPNPAVGCLIVKDGVILGRGATAAGGRPHAETLALKQAGARAKGATAYVTLEPCAHRGKTPPCAQALIKASIARVVAAVKDPDPRTAGKGFQMLRKAGITVTENVARDEAEWLNRGFFLRNTLNRPLVALKTAATLDGRIAMADGTSQWITGEEARRFGQRLRTQYDAIMVGIGTAGKDNPALTCRIDGLAAHQPLRLVVDSQLTLPLTATLVTTAREVPTWLCTTELALSTRKPHAAALGKAGVRVIPINPRPPVAIPALLGFLADEGLTRLLVEGGPRLATSLLMEGAVDELWWFQSPTLMGAEGLAAAQALENKQLDRMPRFTHLESLPLGGDIVHHFRKA